MSPQIRVGFQTGQLWVQVMGPGDVGLDAPDGAFEALFETDVDDRGERMFFPVPHAMEPSRAKQLEAVDAHADARRVLQIADYVGLALRLSRPRAV